MNAALETRGLCKSFGALTVAENIDFRLEAGARNISIELPLQGIADAHGDRELLHRAIENVVRNAVRFSPDGGRVIVTAQPGDAGYTICVQDQGPGVPPELLQRIFEPFYRVESARDRDSGGNGIGLAIAARVFDRHHGSVRADNIDPHGLRVSMRLPT